MKILALAASDCVFGINDPSLIAWVIVLVYFLGMCFCWRAQYSHRVFSDTGNRILWATLSTLLLLLGFNKQLDLHVVVMSTVRNIVSGENRSSALQGVILVCLLAIGGAAFWLGKKLLYHSNRELRAAYIAFLSLLAIQVLRFPPGPAGSLLASHPISEEEGLFHVHFIELNELPILIVVSYWARTQASIRSTHSEQCCSRSLAVQQVHRSRHQRRMVGIQSKLRKSSVMAAALNSSRSFDNGVILASETSYDLFNLGCKLTSDCPLDLS